MISDRPFYIALLISLIVHTTMFFRLPNLNFLPSNRALTQLELTYIQEKRETQNLDTLSKGIFPKPSTATSSKKVAPPPFVKKERIFPDSKNTMVGKPDFVKPELTIAEKKITLPLISNDKIENPTYLNYYQIVREKIRRAAYQNYTRLVNGEVYLSFVIFCNGELRDIRIKDDKSTNSPYLKEIAIKSIYDASPFPNFPKDLNYPELSFNVIISFEVE